MIHKPTFLPRANKEQAFLEDASEGYRRINMHDPDHLGRLRPLCHWPQGAHKLTETPEGGITDFNCGVWG